MTFALLGLLLAAAVITPPVYIYKTDQNYSKMFPILKFGREQLARLASDHNYAANPGVIKTTVIKDGEKTDVIDESLDEKQRHAQTYE